MRTSDPTGYDQFYEIPLAATTYTLPYRAILASVTSTGAKTVVLTIGNTVNGSIATKTMTLYFGASTNTIIPISGESISVDTLTNMKLYVLL